MPPAPYNKLNTDGSAIGNPALASAGGILRNHMGNWLVGFSLHLGISSNNMAELVAVRQGLTLAWDMGFKFIQLELDSITVVHWLTGMCVTYLPHMIPLICDCRNLMDREWEIQVLHIYREANDCADVLAKWGTHQQHLLAVYSSCPTFVSVSYMRDLADLGTSRLCARRPNVVDV